MDPAGSKYNLKNKKLLSYDSEMMDLDFYVNNIYKEPIVHTRHFDMVYSLPFLDKDFCAELLKEIKCIEKKYSYKGNKNEHISVRSPELTLVDKCPELSEHLLNRVCSFGNLFFIKCFDTPVTGGSVHVTKYDSKWNGIQHTDLCDLSVIVSLNENEFVGGGTKFKNGVIKPLPVGSALVFPSYITPHQGLPIETGNRYLLVFWLIRT